MGKGVQLVLLSSWSDASVNRFADVAAAYLGRTFEIGFTPFFNNGKGPFENANALVTKLGSAGYRLRFTVHLSFHRDDKTDKKTLMRRAEKTSEEFIQPNAGKVAISLCPMLEDERWSREMFKEMLEAIAKKVSWGHITKLNFRRSNNTNPNIQGKLVEFIDPKTKRKIVIPDSMTRFETEIHGEIGKSKLAQVYSNDGNFVWFDNPRKVKNLPYIENKNSAQNPKGTSDDKYPVSRFHGNGRTTLLWRPAYNLFTRSVDPITKLVKYTSNTKPKNRSDKNTEKDCAFNVVETEALKVFLGIT
jgi:hypothetical protein